MRSRRRLANECWPNSDCAAIYSCVQLALEARNRACVGSSLAAFASVLLKSKEYAAISLNSEANAANLLRSVAREDSIDFNSGNLVNSVNWMNSVNGHSRASRVITAAAALAYQQKQLSEMSGLG